ncbi:MAG: type IV secretion system DNA-binding domain-containing protein [Proteobacteria bacterium]|nr:type IV secretion system DNA-binding domain-containing protein [Pseudomonadota bacterium]
MTESRYFPEIITRKTEMGFESLCGVALHSILKGDLLLHEGQNKETNVEFFHQLDPSVMFRSRLSFLQGVSAWERDVTLELHINAVPDLNARLQGTIDVMLIIRVCGENVEKNNERMMARYLSLSPLLAACFPYMEFKPVTDRDLLTLCLSPFATKQALAVVRKTEAVSLATMMERPMIRGFGASHDQTISPLNGVMHLSPWIPAVNDGRTLLEILMRNLDPVKLVFRIRASLLGDDTRNRLAALIETCETHLSGCHDYRITLNRQVSAIRDVALRQAGFLSDTCLDVGVFIFAPCSIGPSLAHSVGRLVTGGPTGDNGDVFQGGFHIRTVDETSACEPDFFPEREPFTIVEATSAFCLPVPPMDDQTGLPIKRFRTGLANLPPAVNDGIRVFDNEHLGTSQPVFCNTQDRMRHMFILGQTGTGKSTLMMNMVLQDIRADKGLAVIDPHGDLVDDIIARMPHNRRQDVILFDLLDREKPVGFNLLEWSTIEERDMIIDSLYETMDRIYDMKQAGGPIFEQYFRGILKLLMMDEPHREFKPTLLEFTLCFLNKDFRQFLKKYTTDPVTLDFVEEMERAGRDVSIENVSPYITSKFSRFINDRTLKMIVGQEHTGFDFSTVMNEGKLLFVKLGRGRFGSTISGLLANQMVNRFKMAAMKRGDMPKEKRREFYLYVDECHTLPTDNFTELLSEARKYRMGLILSTQYTAQLSGGEKKNKLLDAILGNVGMIASFRLGQEDAGKIGKVFEPGFSSRDICGLPNHQGYVRMQTANQVLPPFSFKTILDPAIVSAARASQIRDMSRLKYGVLSRDVEARINYRRKVWKDL